MTTLYKYTSNHKYILEDGYIRATQACALNDPFEGVYCKDSLKKLSEHFEDDTLSGDELIKNIEREKNRIGIISFSESKDNLLMWAHYANDYKGSLIGINRGGYVTGSIFHDLFSYTSDCIFKSFSIFDGKIVPVSYRKQPMYKIDMFDRDYSNISITEENQILYEIFQQKSEEWIYEKEHRIILMLEQADKVVIENLPDEELKSLKNYFDDYSIIEKNLKKNQTFFYLDRIKDNDERSSIASLLSKYSENPDNLYLFKICPHSICSLTLGPNVHSFNCEEYIEKWDDKGYFDVYKTNINKSTYTINFESLYSKW